MSTDPAASSPPSYARELEVALDAARRAGAVVRHHYERGTETWEKSEDNPLTLADLASERAIVERVREAFPGDAILSEETASSRDRVQHRRVWIIDPMDGTKEFTKRIPEFAVSIALAEGGEPVVGVVLNPVAAEDGLAVWATRGGGAFREGRRVSVSPCESLSEAVVIASRSEIGRGEFARYEGWFRELRPMGSIAWKLAVIACGDGGDLNVSVAPKNEWDVCAGDLLVREAGGLYVDFERARRTYNQPETLIEAGMAAANPRLLEAFLAREKAGA